MARWARARLLPSPTKRIFSKIFETVPARNVSVLELFARAGDWHTAHYAAKAGLVELWELDPSFEADLRRRFPRSDVRIVDSYARLSSPATRKFTVVVSDNSASIHGGHCENFDIFPGVFSWLEDRSFLVLNIVPVVDADTRRLFHDAFDEPHMRARKAFYGVDDSAHIFPEQMIAAYGAICVAAGWRVVETAVESRGVVKYLLLGLERTGR